MSETPPPPSSTVAGDAGGLEEVPWRRMHWVTPLIRSWKAWAAFLVFFGRDLPNFWQDLQANADALSGRLLPLILGAMALTLVILVWSVLTWRLTRFRVSGDQIELRSGVFFREHKLARLDRVQSIDVVTPLIGRLLGLCRLKFEVAGGQKSGFSLAYLRDDEARDLRNELLAKAAGVDLADQAVAPAAPEQVLFQVSADRLVRSAALSGAFIWAVFSTIAVAGLLVWTGEPAAVFGIGPMVLGALGVVWQRFTKGFNFTLARSPDGIRLRHGLFELNSQTVPPGRVQAVRITQPWLWRRPGWWHVRMNVAGHDAGHEDGANTSAILMPVATQDEVIGLLRDLLPGFALSGHEGLVRAGMTGMTEPDGRCEDGFTVAPRAARWLDPIAWRRHGFAATEQVLLTRDGRIFRGLSVIPHEKMQSLQLEQGPIQRRLGVASVVAHSTPGPVKPHARHLRQDVAMELTMEQAQRSRTARRSQAPSKWMTQQLASPQQVSPAQVSPQSDGSVVPAPQPDPSP